MNFLIILFLGMTSALVPQARKSHYSYHSNHDVLTKSLSFDWSCKSLSDSTGDNKSGLIANNIWNVDFQGLVIDGSSQKLFNAVILILCFGFSLYTVLSVDNEITRGWTQQEIAMRIPLDNWASYESALQEKPIITKTFINVVIYCLGDWLSQTVFQKKNILDFDAKRTLRNGFIGLCFGPLVHQYYEWSDHILPVEGGLFNRLRKILMDQTLYLSVKCSIYIAAVGLLQGDSYETVIETVKTRIGPICFTAWKFWPLVHCLTYSIIPSQHRILWVNCVDLVWNAILSTMSRQKAVEADQESLPIFSTESGGLSQDHGKLGESMMITSSASEIQDEIVVLDVPNKAFQNKSDLSP
jgi:protein Mpv17